MLAFYKTVTFWKFEIKPKLSKIYSAIMYLSNRIFNIHPGQPPGHLTFFENSCSNFPYPGQNAVQMPHTRVHSGDQMPPPRGHFTDTKMTEGRRKRLQLSNYKVTECSALIFFVMQHKSVL